MRYKSNKKFTLKYLCHIKLENVFMKHYATNPLLASKEGSSQNVKVTNGYNLPSSKVNKFINTLVSNCMPNIKILEKALFVHKLVPIYKKPMSEKGE